MWLVVFFVLIFFSLGSFYFFNEKRKIKNASRREFVKKKQRELINSMKGKKQDS